MADVRDITWKVVPAGSSKPRQPTDPCGATCSECKGEWTCQTLDQDCETPYAMHRCPSCMVQHYVAPYWLHRGKVVRDRRTLENSVILNVSLGLTRQESVVEILPNLDVSESRPDYLRSLVIRVPLADIEQHFEPMAQKLPAHSLP